MRTTQTMHKLIELLTRWEYTDFVCRILLPSSTHEEHFARAWGRLSADDRARVVNLLNNHAPQLKRIPMLGYCRDLTTCSSCDVQIARGERIRVEPDNFWASVERFIWDVRKRQP